MRIFVFGSNLAGIHGAGAAAYALKHHGAKWGEGVGWYGNSYAIPTKDHHLNTLNLFQIEPYVMRFVEFARENPDLEFDLTPIGCGLAGYRRDQIRPLFGNLPNNVHLTPSWDDPDIN